jgi:hypothetical protein
VRRDLGQRRVCPLIEGCGEDLSARDGVANLNHHFEKKVDDAFRRLGDTSKIALDPDDDSSQSIRRGQDGGTGYGDRLIVHLHD